VGVAAGALIEASARVGQQCAARTSVATRPVALSQERRFETLLCQGLLWCPKASKHRNRVRIHTDPMTTMIYTHVLDHGPSGVGKTHVLAVVLHPRDTKQVTIPEPKKK
jgi:hypothetical protein